MISPATKRVPCYCYCINFKDRMDVNHANDQFCIDKYCSESKYESSGSGIHATFLITLYYQYQICNRLNLLQNSLNPIIDNITSQMKLMELNPPTAAYVTCPRSEQNMSVTRMAPKSPSFASPSLSLAKTKKRRSSSFKCSKQPMSKPSPKKPRQSSSPYHPYLSKIRNFLQFIEVCNATPSLKFKWFDALVASLHLTEDNLVRIFAFA